MKCTDNTRYTTPLPNSATARRELATLNIRSLQLLPASCLAVAAMARGRVAAAVTALCLLAAIHSASAAPKDVSMTTMILTTPG